MVMSLEPFENILIAREAGVATLTINRPKVLNALNTQTLDELRRAILALRHDDGVRAVILTGSGDKSFIAGADIHELSVQTPIGGRDLAMRGQHVLDLVENMGKPVVAAINGYALGGGCELRDGLHDADCRRHRETRPARDQPRTVFRGMPARSGWRASSAGAARSSCCSRAIRFPRTKPSASVS